MNILVRNLSREVNESELLQLFLPFGRIKSLTIVTDKVTGKSKGFGFVYMPEDSEAKAAIKALNGKLVHGEKVRVKTAIQSDKSSHHNPDEGRQKRFGEGEMKRVIRGKNSGKPRIKYEKNERRP